MRETTKSRTKGVLGLVGAALVIALSPAAATATHDDPAAPNDPLYEPTGPDGSPPQWGPQQVRPSRPTISAPAAAR